MIRAASLSELANIEHISLSGSDASFDSVSIDTRTLKAGDLFVAIRGEVFDGHSFIAQAEKSGCCGIVSEESIASTKPCLVVKDTTKTLGEIAMLNRMASKGTVIGLTGSSGKTTTKNMITAICSLSGATCATEGNFNNEIGVPLTLLKLEAQHQFAVIEMGARKLGDIRYLGQIVKPDIAILLNAGIAHIEIFGSHENIVATKGEIYQALGDDGIAILNADDPSADFWAKQLEGKKVLRFSSKDMAANDSLECFENTVWAEGIVCSENSTRYTLHYQQQTQDIYLPAPGLHNVSNSLAAAAAAIAAGISLDLISSGLSAMENNSGRLELVQLRDEIALLDDSYNANPNSMKAALKVLDLRTGFKTAVLGEMAELGKWSEKFHSELAEFAMATSIDRFYLVGPYAAQMAACIGERARHFTNNEVLASQLSDELVSGETILVKGSRSARMEEVVNLIKGWAQ